MQSTYSAAIMELVLKDTAEEIEQISSTVKDPIPGGGGFAT
jgi:hypothetical protein